MKETKDKELTQHWKMTRSSDQTSSMNDNEKVILEEVRKHQHWLWEEFKAGRGPSDWLEGSVAVPNEEELQLIKALLRKKGIPEPPPENLRNSDLMNEDSSYMYEINDVIIP